MKNDHLYTTKLQAGLGMIPETKTLLELWEPGMKNSELFQISLGSGIFSNISARRLQNIVRECFAPRYILKDNYPALVLKNLKGCLTSNEFSQLLFIFTARANPIFYDFVKEVYWEKYISGQEALVGELAREFVISANHHGKTVRAWSEGTVKRVSTYLLGCCSDFGLLGNSVGKKRQFKTFRIEPKVASFLAYDLHFLGVGDNSILAHEDWRLFGYQKNDVRDEFNRISRTGVILYQTAGDLIRISWKYKNWGEIINVFSEN